MLTNGKKVWGIWYIPTGEFMKNCVTGSIEVYDDYQVISADIGRNRPDSDYEIRVISEGHGSNVPGAYPSNMETKIDCNAQSTTVG